MKKLSLKKIVLAGAFAAVPVAAVPVAMFAEPADKTIDLTEDVIEIDRNSADSYADGIEFILNLGGDKVPESITTQDGKTINVVPLTSDELAALGENEDGITSKAVFNLPALDENGAIQEGELLYNITLHYADADDETAVIKYKIVAVGDNNTGADDSAGSNAGDGSDDQNETNPGDNTGDENGDKTDASTEKTIAFDANVTVKVNGTSAVSGNKVVTGDKIAIVAPLTRGKSLTSISVDGTALALDGNTAEYTVKDGDTEIKIAAVIAEADSYTVSIPDNVSATVIADSGNILLANGSKVYDGEKVKISAAPADQTLKSLKVNGSAITNGQTITVSGTNLNIEVEFEAEKELAVTIPEGVAVSKGDTALKNGDKVKVGDSLKISAAKQGYSVKTLKVNGADFVSGSSYTVTDADTDVKIEVEFVADVASNTFPVTIKAYDSEDSALKGVVILVKDANKKTVATAETDKKGTISLDVAPGRYTYAVSDVPDGYISPSGSYTFTVSDAGKVKGTTNITVAQSEVILKKVDSISKKGVEGVSIIVKNEDKETVATGVTNSKGELTITGLPEGKYTYSERYAAPGYASDDTQYKFSIGDDGEVTGTTSTEVTPVSIVFSVRDYASGKGLQGATLMIKNQLGRTVATVTTDSKGEASVPGLAAGRYTLVQSEAPSGYSKSTDEYTFDVLESGLVSGTTSISNKEKASSNSGSNMTNNANGSQSATAPGANGNQSSTAPGANNNNAGSNTANGNGANTTTTGTNTTTVAQPTGGKTQGTVKTGVETVAPKSKAPIIAGIVGAVGVIAGAASIARNKIRGKKNDIQ